MINFGLMVEQTVNYFSEYDYTWDENGKNPVTLLKAAWTIGRRHLDEMGTQLTPSQRREIISESMSLNPYPSHWLNDSLERLTYPTNWNELTFFILVSTLVDLTIKSCDSSGANWQALEKSRIEG